MSSQSIAHPIGTVIARRTAGTVAIHISTALGGFTVTCWNGVEQVAGWCAGYPTWDEARNAANHARDAFKLHRTVEAIDSRRQHLTIELQTTRSRAARSRTPRIYTPAIDMLESELDQLDDLSTRRLGPALVADVTAFLNAA